MRFSNYCRAKVTLVNEFLQDFLCTGSISEVERAMSYSLMAGGKRLRPLLLMAAADSVGVDGNKFVNVAGALEMIHTYSLIHDDLPAMDNDDYRRGKLTNHKVFGEDMAILAGDGLLTLAFESIATQKDVDAALLLQIVRDIAYYAGRCGMVGGQAIDVKAQGDFLSQDELVNMHQAKTGALFKAAICSGGKLAQADEQQLFALEQFAQLYGLVFQITDDILDVEGDFESLGKPIGSDEKNNKVTYVSTYGLDGAKKLSADLVEKAEKQLLVFGENSWILSDFLRQLLIRKS